MLLSDPLEWNEVNDDAISVASFKSDNHLLSLRQIPEGPIEHNQAINDSKPA